MTDNVLRMSRDIAAAASTLSDQEARYLVDAYYIMQEDRKRACSQGRAVKQSADEENAVSENSVIAWLAEQSTTLEKQIARALDKYTQAHAMGSWMREVVGIGPIISAGMLAHIDITKAPTAGHIWRYAGLDPTQVWVGKDRARDFYAEHGANFELAAERFGLNVETLRKNATTDKGKATKESFTKALSRRPWDAGLKTLCWKAGQSFMKFSGREDCYYGRIYLERKAYEIARNDRGDNAELAGQLKEKFGKSTEAFKHLSVGKLPPGQIDARARRYAVKLFLSHMHNEWYLRHHGTPAPLPYPIAILGHAHLKVA